MPSIERSTEDSSTNIQPTRALISVSDKRGVTKFAAALSRAGVALLSTGGTAKLLRTAGLEVKEVSEHTGSPEIMDGRVKTLHPKIHGGLLGRRGIDEVVMESHEIAPIDLLVVNLYPFEAAVARPDCSLEEAIENIDIGGPAMIRAAAKNHASVAVVVDPDDYQEIADTIAEERGLDRTRRFNLASKAFAHTARYDGMIANYLGGIKKQTSIFPDRFNLQVNLVQELRYGENPHQAASFYADNDPPAGTIAASTQLQGKPLSYNNLADADAALECVKGFENGHTCVIVKHANPCGVATANDQMSAYDLAFATDPTSAFGGIIAFNAKLEAEVAEEILRRQFVEVVIAPEVDTKTAALFGAKPNVRLLQSGAWSRPHTSQLDYKRIAGGLLIQQTDGGSRTAAELSTVTNTEPTPQQLADLLFAWRVVKYVKSNAIVYVRGQQTIGIGAGQMSRVISAKIAGIKAAEADLAVPGSVMASDAFFPFRDSIDAAAEAGVSAVIQPGGSMRDQEVIDAANEHGMAMVFTGMRHFRH